MDVSGKLQALAAFSPGRRSHRYPLGMRLDGPTVGLDATWGLISFQVVIPVLSSPLGTQGTGTNRYAAAMHERLQTFENNMK